MKPLILITDGGKLRECGELVDSITCALEGAKGSVESVLLREQFISERGVSISDSELLSLAEALSPVCKENDSKLIIHSRKDLMKETNFFDGVHLNAATWNISKAEDNCRAGVDTKFQLGYSAHSLDECQQASAAGADYIFLSPIFDPISKEAERLPLGVTVLSEATRLLSTPIIALGGIDAQRAAICRDAGASGVAVVGGVLLADDVGVAAAAIAESWM
jgi:thiamine-phosphate pyrophosphorylase